MSSQNTAPDEPLSYAIRLRERAVRDINAAYVRFAEVATEEIADEWRDGLMDTIASLAYFPRRCPLAPERFHQEVRQLLYRRPGSQVAYRILFTITDEEETSEDPPTVRILHIRHAASRPITRNQAREIETEE